MATGPAPMRSHSSTTSTKADGFRRIEATTVSAVARRYGLHANQLFTWRQRLATPAVRGVPAFVPVVVAEDNVAPAEMAGRMEIALGPAVVRVGADVDAAALRRVLEVVRGLA